MGKDTSDAAADAPSATVVMLRSASARIAAQVEIEQLHRQLEAGHPRLRFEGPLEAQFRQAYERAAVGPRTVLLVLASLMVGITPLYDVSLLGAVPEYAQLTHLIQWIVMLPALLVGLAVLRVSWTIGDAVKQALMIGAVFGAWAGLTAQRAIAGYFAFHFPHDFGIIAIAATFAMGRLRFFQFLPWALVMLAASLAVELLRQASPDMTAGGAINNSMSMAMMWVISAAGAWLFEHVSRGAWLRQEIYRRMATQDSLTGLSNRHHFQLTIGPLIQRAIGQHLPLTVMLIDIDHFKAYNDHYGHVAGDDCLRRIGASLLDENLPVPEVCARIGGEEFVVVWFGIGPGESGRLAEGLRDGVTRLAIAHARSPTSTSVTASAGLIHGVPGPRITADSLLRSADGLLYAAKEAGRNRLVASFGSLEPPPRTGTVVPFSARSLDLPS